MKLSKPIRDELDTTNHKHKSNENDLLAAFKPNVIITNNGEDHSKATQRKSSKINTRGKPNMVRTVFMPNESVDVMKQIISSLKRQLEEQTTLANQRHQALLEDRLIRETEIEESNKRSNEQIDKLERDLVMLGTLHHTTTRDYLELRHNSQVKEKRFAEEIMNLKMKCLEEQQFVMKVQTGAQQHANQVEQDSEELVSRFRGQALGREEELNILKAQLGMTHKLYQERIDELQNRLNDTKQRLKNLERRRAMDLEGFVNDFRVIRSQVKDVSEVLSSGGKLDLAKALVAENQIKFIKDELNKIAWKLGLT